MMNSASAGSISGLISGSISESTSSSPIINHQMHDGIDLDLDAIDIDEEVNKYGMDPQLMMVRVNTYDQDVVKDINKITTTDDNGILYGEKDDNNNDDIDFNELRPKRDGLLHIINTLESQCRRRDQINNELNERIKALEHHNAMLMHEIDFLKTNKTALAINSTKCIDDLRTLLVEYQKLVNN